MRKKLQKPLFDEFLGRAQELGFVRVKAPNQNWCRVSKISPKSTHCFIQLGAHETEDRFVVDLAWSPNDHYPTLQVFWPSEEETEEGFSVRLSELADPDQNMHLAYEFEEPKSLEWFETATLEQMIAPPPAIEELMPKIPIFLDEVFQQIREYGIPFFEDMGTRFVS